MMNETGIAVQLGIECRERGRDSCGPGVEREKDDRGISMVRNLFSSIVI